MVEQIQYPFEIRPLSEEEGGGYLIIFPDLPGCMSDEKTIEEAIMNGYQATSPHHTKATSTIHRLFSNKTIDAMLS